MMRVLIFLLRCLQLLLGAFLFTASWKSYTQTASCGRCGSSCSGNAGHPGRHQHAERVLFRILNLNVNALVTYFFARYRWRGLFGLSGIVSHT